MSKKLEGLSDQDLLRLEEVRRREIEKRMHAEPYRWSIRWHKKQDFAADEGIRMVQEVDGSVRIIIVAGGNRSGKSATGKRVMSEVIHRVSPINDQLKYADPITGEIKTKGPRAPLRIWIVPPTLEKFRSDWAWPADGMGIRHWLGDRFLKERESPDHVFYAKIPGVDPYDDTGKIDTAKVDIVLAKSHDQKLETFESSEADLIIVDEEIQDPKKVTSMLQRIGTVNGVLMMTFTPLHGLSWSYERWWKPLVKDGAATKVADRSWVYAPPKGRKMVLVQMGTADNPKAIRHAEETLRDRGMSKAEKDARVYGEYGYVEGALVPDLAGLDVSSPNLEHHQYVVDQLPGREYTDDEGKKRKTPGDISQWYMVCDPNKSHGAILSCMDEDGNLFLVAEHLEQDWPTRKHSKSFKRLYKRYLYPKERQRVREFADYGAAGAQVKIDLNDMGHHFSNVRKKAGSVSQSIKRLRQLASPDPQHHHPITGEKGAPYIYFYRPGLVVPRIDNGMIVKQSQTAEQISSARQKEGAPPDTPDKDARNKLDLWDCLRYTAIVARSSGDQRDDNEKRHSNSTRFFEKYDSLTARRQDDKFDPLDRAIWTPEYMSW